MFESVRNTLAAAITKALPSSMTGGVSTAFGGTPPMRGTRELLEMYRQSPWLRAVVHKIGYSVAQVPWRLYVPRDSQGKAISNPRLARYGMEKRRTAIKHAVDAERVDELLEHPMLDLINNGNDSMTGMSVLQVTQHHLDLVGEGFWLLERSGVGAPVALWPLPPDWVTSTPSASNQWWKIRMGSAELKIPASEIIAFKDPDPSNPYGRGVGTGRALGDELEIDEYAAKHNKAFFYNRARPDMIISGDNLSPDDSKRLEQTWLEKHQGFWNRFKPLFFSRKIDIKELGQSFENIQMVQLRKHERDTFISVFGVSPEKLGVVSDSKRSTIAAADMFWNKDVIAPRAELMRTVMQKWLVPMFDERLILDFDTPVAQDDEFELEQMKAAPWAYTLNEWRRVTGRAGLGEGGDQLMIPLNSMMVPMDDLVGFVSNPGQGVDSGSSDSGKDAPVGVTAAADGPVAADPPSDTGQVVEMLQRRAENSRG